MGRHLALLTQNETSDDGYGTPQSINRSYTYDGLGRLETAYGPWLKVHGDPNPLTWTMTYDPLGNPRQLDGDDPNHYARTWSYNDPNKPRFLKSFNEWSSYSAQTKNLIDFAVPDAAGNPVAGYRVQMKEGAETRPLIWNAQGKLHARNGYGNAYYFDAFGRRTGAPGPG